MSNAYRDDLDAALARIAALEAENRRLREADRVFNNYDDNYPPVAQARVLAVRGKFCAMVSAADRSRRRRSVQSAGHSTWQQALAAALRFFDETELTELIGESSRR